MLGKAFDFRRHDRAASAADQGNRRPATDRRPDTAWRNSSPPSVEAAAKIRSLPLWQPFIATTGDFTRLRPDEKATVMTLAETPLLAPLIRKVDSDRIALRNGAEIIVQTNNIRAPRGRTIACSIYDEAAHWRGEDFTSPDTEVDNAITPGLMRFSGSLKIIISSVHRRSGLLHDKYPAHFGQDDDDVLVVLGTSLQFNPTLDEAEIERQLALDPEKAGAEYLSHWRDDLTSFLDRALGNPSPSRR
jgi:hypothetical protein